MNLFTTVLSRVTKDTGNPEAKRCAGCNRSIAVPSQGVALRALRLSWVAVALGRRVLGLGSRRRVSPHDSPRANAPWSLVLPHGAQSIAIRFAPASEWVAVGRLRGAAMKVYCR